MGFRYKNETKETVHFTRRHRFGDQAACIVAVAPGEEMVGDMTHLYEQTTVAAERTVEQVPAAPAAEPVAAAEPVQP